MNSVKVEDLWKSIGYIKEVRNIRAIHLVKLLMVAYVNFGYESFDTSQGRDFARGWAAQIPNTLSFYDRIQEKKGRVSACTAWTNRAYDRGYLLRKGKEGRGYWYRFYEESVDNLRDFVDKNKKGIRDFLTSGELDEFLSLFPE